MDHVIVFDLGGTLMEYVGMPHSWYDYYEACFRTVDAAFSLGLTEEDVRRSVEILREYNPRYKPREIEHPPEFLFQEATRHWRKDVPLSDIIAKFFSGMRLTARIYPDTVPLLTELRRAGVKTAALTNLPSAMPDRLFRADIPQLLDLLDLYVSSESCGWRKPNPAGLAYIAERFGADPKDLLFIGDEKLDIDTAKRAGCTSVLICRTGEPRDYAQDHTVRDLAGLEALLRQEGWLG